MGRFGVQSAGLRFFAKTSFCTPKETNVRDKPGRYERQNKNCSAITGDEGASPYVHLEILVVGTDLWGRPEMFRVVVAELARPCQVTPAGAQDLTEYNLSCHRITTG